MEVTPTPKDPAGSTILRLRPWVEIRRLGPREFLLLDRTSGMRLIVGAEERFLLHELARAECLDQVETAFELQFRRPLERRHLRDFMTRLGRLGLAEPHDEAGPHRPEASEAPPPSAPAEAAPPPEPLSDRDGGSALNSRFDLLVVLFGWVLHPIWTPAILLAFVAAIGILIAYWGEVIPDLMGPVQEYPRVLILSMSLLQTLLFVNLTRALLTGIICRRFGGRLRRFGLRISDELLLLTFYCETGDSFAFMSERGKLTWLTADLWAQLAIGAAAIFGWRFCEPRSAVGVFCLFLIPPCLFGILINLNIFLPYRGYWLLCHATDDPRLRERALGETSAWLLRRPAPEPLTAGERYWLRAYGLGYYLFRIAFMPLAFLGLGLWLTDRFDGIGALILLAIAFWYYRKSIEEFLMGITAFRWVVRCGGRWWFRWLARLGLVAGLVALGFVPYNYEIVGECRLLPAGQQGVRIQLTDEVAEVLVTEGLVVEPGQVIARLVGREVGADLQMTEAELQKARAQLELLRNGPRKENLNIDQNRVEIRQSQLEASEAKLKRTENLYRRSSASKTELDLALHDRDEARLNLLSARESLSQLQVGYRPEEVEAAEAEVRRLEAKLKYNRQLVDLTELTSPIRGRVALPYMEQRPGHATSPGDLLTVLYDDSGVEAEVAADDAAALYVVPGMPVNIRLHGDYGRLMRGRVSRLAPMAEPASAFGNRPTRTESEIYQEQMLNSRYHSSGHHVRVYVEVEDAPLGLKAEMTGYARIVVREDVLWQALVRPVVRFLRTEVWSWLP